VLLGTLLLPQLGEVDSLGAFHRLSIHQAEVAAAGLSGVGMVETRVHKDRRCMDCTFVVLLWWWLWVGGQEVDTDWVVAAILEVVAVVAVVVVSIHY